MHEVKWSPPEESIARRVSKPVSTGKCQLCGEIVNRAAMARHLSLCAQKAGSRLSAGPSFHLVVEGRRANAYWMHVAVPVDTKLSKLDRFLRKIWLECCGHLSAFEITGERYGSSPMDGEMGMNRSLKQVVGVGMSFFYEYDYGSTTELKLKVAGVREDGTPKGAVQLLAKNEPPAILCQTCATEVATEICAECAWEEMGWLCPECAETHSCAEEMRLPVTNSPRVGVCAYSG
jgi:hypothetical protein